MSNEDQVGNPGPESAELSATNDFVDIQGQQLNTPAGPEASQLQRTDPSLEEYAWGRAYFKFGEFNELDVSGEFPALALLVVVFGPILAAVFGWMVGLPLVAVLATTGIVTLAVVVLVIVFVLVKRQ